MNRAGKLWMVLLVAAVGLWGCSEAVSPNGQADKIKALQDKCARLEDDFKSAATARDQARKQLSALQDEHAQMEEQLACAPEGRRGRQGGRQGARRAAPAAGRPHRRARHAPNAMRQDEEGPANAARPGRRPVRPRPSADHGRRRDRGWGAVRFFRRRPISPGPRRISPQFAASAAAAPVRRTGRGGASSCHDGVSFASVAVRRPAVRFWPRVCIRKQSNWPSPTRWAANSSSRKKP